MKEGVPMKKRLIHTKQKKLDLLIIISVLSLALLAVSPACCSDLNNSSSSQAGHVLKLIPVNNSEEPGFSKFVLSDEGSGPFQQVEQYVDLIYTFGGIGAALLILLMYRRMASKEQEMIKRPPQAPDLHKIWKTLGLEKLNQEEYEATRIRLFTAIPVVCIGIAELLIFAGKMKLAIWIHIGVLIALSLSDIVIKDLKVYRIYQALMLLPILRLVNLSMPVFFNTTLYTFVFVYAPLLVPLAIIVINQRSSFEHIGITAKNLPAYIILSIPLGFLLGLGEYLTIHPGYLIKELSIVNLLILTFIMVFLVGLVEEIIFRSLLQTRLEDALGVKEAVLIAGLLFGLMHSGYGTFHEVLYTGFVGLFMGFAFYKTRSLPFVVVLHGLVNVFLFGIFPHYLSSWTIF
ncbi:CAAX amino terminal protease family protein [Methanosarcina barkeri str. Wiesmoor]|uniref:CAAX amino terminal protease family protein n=2 Tax=Methanosarcina barkeri TaxID=2208 RepID=A0A0E3QK40_METBA|nr:CAAX amino terminal protease family protein [Methanosarcina barkeri str. Wiesmoor]